MKIVNKEELKEILEKHLEWLKTRFSSKPKGERADLQEADLRRADLQGADLQEADLQEADLQGADLQEADLRRANLQGAYLRLADLQGANLQGANLQRANLQGAYLQGAYLQGAYLQDENGENRVKLHFYNCPEKGSFTAYKSVTDGRGKKVILELQIPASAKRVSSMIGRKCRASKAKVIRAFDSEQTTFYSRHDRNFIYEVGQVAKCNDFDDDVRIECTRGIHFFITRLEAEEW